MSRRGLITVLSLSVLAVVLGGGIVVYLFGGPSDGPATLPGTVAISEAKVAGPVSQGGEAWFGIPGCTCHSDDPAVVEEHRGYRLQDCAECH